MTAVLACSLACLLFNAFDLAIARRSSTDCPRTEGAILSPVAFGDNSDPVEATEGEAGRSMGLVDAHAIEAVEGIRIESNSLAP